MKSTNHLILIKMKTNCTYFIWPSAGHSSEPPHTPPQFDVFVIGVQIFQALFQIGCNPLQSLPAEQNTRTSHTEVFIGVKRKKAELLAVSSARLPNEPRFSTVHWPQKSFKTVSPHVDIVVSPHEPFESTATTIFIVRHRSFTNERYFTFNLKMTILKLLNYNQHQCKIHFVQFYLIDGLKR